MIKAFLAGFAAGAIVIGLINIYYRGKIKAELQDLKEAARRGLHRSI